MRVLSSWCPTCHQTYKRSTGVIWCPTLSVFVLIMNQYLRVPGPGGELLEELCDRPQAVSIRLLDSSTAAVSWAPSSENHNGSLVSVVSTTCLRPSLSQRMENKFCSEVTWEVAHILINQHSLH